MAIGNIGSGAFLLGQSALNLTSQLGTLQTQLATGKKSTTYAGMGVNEGFAIAARAQLAGIDAFSDTMTKIDTTIGVADTALQALVSIGKQMQISAAGASQGLNSGGQTNAQQAAASQLSSMLGILNTRSGDRYVFSGSAITTPSVASADDILNGNGAAAGLKQLIAERRQADLGASGLGRVVIAQPTATAVSVSEDTSGSPFGLKLLAVVSTLNGATATGPTGSPPAASVGLGASNPSAGEGVTFTFALPDGTSQSIALTASNTTPTPAGSFAIGATPAATAASLKAALTDAIATLSNTSLVAASAMQASQNFFGSPPLRVSGSPASATALVAGTAANTVAWYTGEAGPGPARATSIARVDPSVTVQYGARANEDGVRTQLQTIAAFAAVSTSASDPNAGGQISALSQRVANALSAPAGQRITDVQAEFSAASMTIRDAKARQTQTKTMLQGIVDQAEAVSATDVATQILALQTSLQASYQTTAMLSQLSLLKFL